MAGRPGWPRNVSQLHPRGAEKGVTRYTFTILEELRSAVQRSVLRDKWNSLRFSCAGSPDISTPGPERWKRGSWLKKLLEVEQAAVLERTPVSMVWSTTPFYNALKRAEPKDFAVAVVHSHPKGPLAFLRPMTSPSKSSSKSW